MQGQYAQYAKFQHASPPGPAPKSLAHFYDVKHYPARRWLMHEVYPGRPWLPTYTYTMDNIPPKEPVYPNPTDSTLGYEVPKPPKLGNRVQPLKLSAQDPAVNLEYPVESYFTPWERENFSHVRDNDNNSNDKLHPSLADDVNVPNQISSPSNSPIVMLAIFGALICLFIHQTT